MEIPFWTFVWGLTAASAVMTLVGLIFLKLWVDGAISFLVVLLYSWLTGMAYYRLALPLYVQLIEVWGTWKLYGALALSTTMWIMVVGTVIVLYCQIPRWYSRLRHGTE